MPVQGSRKPYELYDEELGKRPGMSSEERAVFLDDFLRNKKLVGQIKPPARRLDENEGILITAEQGLQSRKSGGFEKLINGTHLDPKTCYLWTIDERGINIALESTPFPTPRGCLVHTNISGNAYVGGEAWFDGKKVVINANSGRFGTGAKITEEAWQGAIRYWQHLGYEVEAIQLGKK